MQCVDLGGFEACDRDIEIILDQEVREGGESIAGQEHADAPNSLGLLRAHCERPRRRRAAEERDELAASHAGHGGADAGNGMRPSPARRSRVPPRGRSDASPAPAASARSSRPSRSRSG